MNDSDPSLTRYSDLEHLAAELAGMTVKDFLELPSQDRSRHFRKAVRTAARTASELPSSHVLGIESHLEQPFMSYDRAHPDEPFAVQTHDPFNFRAFGSGPPEPEPPDITDVQPQILEHADLYRHLVVSSQDIAWLATKEGDSPRAPSIVSHWRKSDKGFPEPEAVGRSPRFRLDEVLRWMHEKLRTPDEEPFRVPSGDWLWRHAVQLLPPLALTDRLPELRAFLAAFVAERGRVDPPEPGTVFRETVDIQSDLEPIREALGLALEESSPADVLEQGLEVLSTFGGTSHTTPDALARLIAQLALLQAGPDTTLVDLGCGEGRVLSHLLDIGAQHHFRRMLGVDNNQQALDVANHRLRLAGYESQGLALTNRNALEPGLPQFTLACADPPDNATEDWTTTSVGLLEQTPSARALLVVSARDLKPEGALCSTTLCRNVEAVILLPAGIRSKTSGSSALCLLTNEAFPRDEILLIDVSDRTLEIADARPRDRHRGARAQVHDRELSEAIRHWRTRRRVEVESLQGRWRSIGRAEAQRAGFERVRPDIPSGTREAMQALQRELESLQHGIDAYDKSVGDLLKRLTRLSATTDNEKRAPER